MRTVRIWIVEINKIGRKEIINNILEEDLTIQGG